MEYYWHLSIVILLVVILLLLSYHVFYVKKADVGASNY